MNFMFLISLILWNGFLVGQFEPDTSKWCWKIAQGFWVALNYEMSFMEIPSDGSGK